MCHVVQPPGSWPVGGNETPLPDGGDPPGPANPRRRDRRCRRVADAGHQERPHAPRFGPGSSSFGQESRARTQPGRVVGGLVEGRRTGEKPDSSVTVMPSIGNRPGRDPQHSPVRNVPRERRGKTFTPAKPVVTKVAHPGPGRGGRVFRSTLPERCDSTGCRSGWEVARRSSPLGLLTRSPPPTPPRRASRFSSGVHWVGRSALSCQRRHLGTPSTPNRSRDESVWAKQRVGRDSRFGGDQVGRG